MTKGAPDVIFNNCAYYYDNGEIKEMTDADRAKLNEENDGMARQAYRVLAMSYKYEDEKKDEYTTEEDERDMIFAGMVAEIDPERPEVKDSIREANEAGIRVVMITGDHPITAAAIAQRLGIIQEGEDLDKVVRTGAQLDAMSDEELAATLNSMMFTPVCHLNTRPVSLRHGNPITRLLP